MAASTLLGVSMMIFQSLFGSSSHAKDIDVGAPVPQVTGIDQDGATVDLGKLATSEKRVLVYFYPKADTPGCTAQACSIRDEFVVLQKRDITVLGVSTDSVEAQKKFQTKHRLPFRLISDKDHKWADAFGVPVKLGFASRQAFLIEDGKLIWVDRSASTKEQAQDVLQILEKRDKQQ